MRNTLTTIWTNNRFFIILISLMVLFRTSFADWNEVPTGSMKPTIIEGDRILVNKIAYDLNLPFSHISLKHFADPSYGDIVIFDSKKAGKRLVKRVIGVPGDIIEMKENALIINGKPLRYKLLAHKKNALILEEKFNHIAHKIRLNYPLQNQHSSFVALKIPEKHYLVLGDNRNNSADSRLIGLIPRDEILGRSQRVVISMNYDNYYLPRLNRFLHTF